MNEVGEKNSRTPMQLRLMGFTYMCIKLEQHLHLNTYLN